MVLKDKIRFPRDFDKNAKSLIKHLCEHDLSKRYGNLQKGVDDIKNHKFFRGFDFEALINQRLQAAHIPIAGSNEMVKAENNDHKHLPEFNDNGKFPPIKADRDSFLSWF